MLFISLYCLCFNLVFASFFEKSPFTMRSFGTFDTSYNKLWSLPQFIEQSLLMWSSTYCSNSFKAFCFWTSSKYLCCSFYFSILATLFSSIILTRLTVSIINFVFEKTGIGALDFCLTLWDSLVSVPNLLILSISNFLRKSDMRLL